MDIENQYYNSKGEQRGALFRGFAGGREGAVRPPRPRSGCPSRPRPLASPGISRPTALPSPRAGLVESDELQEALQGFQQVLKMETEQGEWCAPPHSLHSRPPARPPAHTPTRPHTHSRGAGAAVPPPLPPLSSALPAQGVQGPEAGGEAALPPGAHRRHAGRVPRPPGLHALRGHAQRGREEDQLGARLCEPVDGRGAAAGKQAPPPPPRHSEPGQPGRRRPGGAQASAPCCAEARGPAQPRACPTTSPPAPLPPGIALHHHINTRMLAA